LQQDHDLQKQTEDIDVLLATKQSQIFHLVLRFKKNMVNGVSRDPSVMFGLSQFMPTIKPLNHAKQLLRAKAATSADGAS
jgi:hypothetical protein